MPVEITLEDGTVLSYDIADPNYEGLIRPKLPKSSTNTWTEKQIQEYARQIATMGFYARVGDRTRYYSPECICCVEVPGCLDLN